MRRTAVLLLLLIAFPLHAGELQQFGDDVKSMALAPLHWTKAEWASARSISPDGAVPYIAYAIAVTVAYSRVNDNVHWPSDVVAGALIGRAVAKSVVFHNRRAHVRPVVVNRGAGMLFEYSP